MKLLHRHAPVLLCATLVLFSSCAGKRVSHSTEETHPEVMGPVIPSQNVEEQPVENSGESYGPAAPEGGTIPAEIVTATATATATDTATAAPTVPAGQGKLCVVLGPGMAKAMAEAAVLASLRKAKIPVHCVVGTEMGALVGALYAFSNGSTNNLQWQLFKLHKNTYLNFPMLSLQEPKSTGRKLNEFFRGIFKDKKIEELPIKFATTAVDDERETPIELERGDLSDALSASVALPGVFDPWKARDGAYHSSALSDPAPIELAKKLGGNFIVLVDVLADSAPNVKSRFQKTFTASRNLMKLQKKEATFSIQVNAAAIPYDDFSRQGEILAAGTAAAEKALPDLKAAWERWSAGAR